MPATLTEVLPPTKTSPSSAIRFIPGDIPGTGTLEIQDKRTVTRYAAFEFPCGFDGRAVRLVKFDGTPGSDADADAYAVFVGRAGDHRCDCKGHSYTGHCKHVAAVKALLDNGWL